VVGVRRDVHRALHMYLIHQQCRIRMVLGGGSGFHLSDVRKPKKNEADIFGKSK
jgi:hypothetical protein